MRVRHQLSKKVDRGVRFVCDVCGPLDDVRTDAQAAAHRQVGHDHIARRFSR